jgi:bifunctional DNA-binding transcriptional regulator/antitoxin component of YhaV-PrlF toxin-antitoxin module
MSLISCKNRVTLPVDAMREAGLQPGDDLCVRAVAPGRVELTRAEDVVAEFARSTAFAAPEPGRG